MSDQQSALADTFAAYQDEYPGLAEVVLEVFLTSRANPSLRHPDLATRKFLPMTELSARATRRVWYWCIALGALTIIATGIVLFHTYWGDPVIYLSYARNIARGDFFSYNPGEFSSGSTSPLWAVLLAFPYLFGADHVGARILSILVTLFAFGYLAYAVRRINGASAGSGAALLYLIQTLTIFGIMMYESSLVIIAVTASILAGEYVMRRWSEEGVLRFSVLLPLVLGWSLLPLSRPDALALMAIQGLALWIAGPVRTTASFVRLALAGVVAVVPASLYYGASFALLGLLSVSSSARAFALKESATHIGPVLYSKPALAYLGSILPELLFAGIGINLLQRQADRRWIGLFTLGALLTYSILVTFISPVVHDLPRYFLPIVPLIVLAAGRTFREWENRTGISWEMAAAVLVVLLVSNPMIVVLRTAVVQSEQGYVFEEIVEREVVSKLNAIAQPGESVLAYEVQDRYLLRDDVKLYSLDGITDARVSPYRKSSDMRSFLLRHRPTYWVANDAVNYRPYLRRSMLKQVVDSFVVDTTRTTLVTNGIRFELLERRRRPLPEWFAGWTHLFRLHYDASRR